MCMEGERERERERVRVSSEFVLFVLFIFFFVPRLSLFFLSLSLSLSLLHSSSSSLPSFHTHTPPPLGLFVGHQLIIPAIKKKAESNRSTSFLRSLCLLDPVDTFFFLLFSTIHILTSTPPHAFSSSLAFPFFLTAFHLLLPSTRS